MNDFNINIYERIQSIKSSINQFFNNENTPEHYNYSDYQSQRPDNNNSYDPYTVLEEEANLHQQERHLYNQRLE
jgi:hypothetical protein